MSYYTMKIRHLLSWNVRFYIFGILLTSYFCQRDANVNEDGGGEVVLSQIYNSPKEYNYKYIYIGIIIYTYISDGN